MPQSIVLLPVKLIRTLFQRKEVKNVHNYTNMNFLMLENRIKIRRSDLKCNKVQVFSTCEQIALRAICFIGRSVSLTRSYSLGAERKFDIYFRY